MKREVRRWRGELTFGHLWEKDASFRPAGTQLPGPAPLQLCLLQPSRLQPHPSAGIRRGLLGGEI